MKRTADEFIKTNKEFVKLRNRQGSGVGNTPREHPKNQIPGYRGHDKPEYEQWTERELLELAKILDIDKAEVLSRKELLVAIREKEKP